MEAGVAGPEANLVACVVLRMVTTGQIDEFVLFQEFRRSCISEVVQEYRVRDRFNMTDVHGWES